MIDLNAFLPEIFGTKCQCDRHYVKESQLLGCCPTLKIFLIIWGIVKTYITYIVGI